MCVCVYQIGIEKKQPMEKERAHMYVHRRQTEREEKREADRKGLSVS